MPSLPLLGFFLCLSFFGLFVMRKGRTGGPILMMHAPYDVIAPEDVLFGGFVDIAHHLGSHIPQYSILGRAYAF